MRRSKGKAREWVKICLVEELPVDRGVIILAHGQAIAVFRTADDQVYALGNHEPYGRSAAIKGVKGIAGDRRVPRRRAVRRLAAESPGLRPAHRALPGGSFGARSRLRHQDGRRLCARRPASHRRLVVLDRNDQSCGYRRHSLAAAGQAQSVGGGRADGDRRADAGGESLLGLGAAGA